MSKFQTIQPDFLKRPKGYKPKTTLVKKAMKPILAKLAEPSTVRGILALAAALGVTIEPAYHEHIIAAFLALVGIINVWRSEPKIPKAEVIEND